MLALLFRDLPEHVADARHCHDRLRGLVLRQRRVRSAAVGQVVESKNLLILLQAVQGAPVAQHRLFEVFSRPHLPFEVDVSKVEVAVGIERAKLQGIVVGLNSIFVDGGAAVSEPQEEERLGSLSEWEPEPGRDLEGLLVEEDRLLR